MAAIETAVSETVMFALSTCNHNIITLDHVEFMRSLETRLRWLRRLEGTRVDIVTLYQGNCMWCQRQTLSMQAVFSLSASGRETDIAMRSSKLRSFSSRSNTPSPSWISGLVDDGRHVRMVETISTRQLNDSLRVLPAQIHWQRK